MRKNLLLCLLAFSLSITGFSQRNCASYELLKQQMEANPVFAKKVQDAEKKFQQLKSRGGIKPAKETITIPVVVHVVYNTPEENIPQDQVQSQIDVLNEDFTATNRDYRSYDAGYGQVKGDPELRFCLVQTIRTATNNKSFIWNDAVKYSKRGGSDAVDPAHNLNIWVCDLGKNLLGYAQFPGGNPETDGIVIDYQATGRGNFPVLYPEFNLGRTATHEIGHWLGLRHIWGDATCGNDFVDDTPLHNGPNFRCPGEGHGSTCTGTPLEMWMNYMDYTDDRCMYFFSDLQVERVNYFLQNDPARTFLVANSSCDANLITRARPTHTHESISERTFIVYPTVTSASIHINLGHTEKETAELLIKNIAGIEVFRKSIGLQKGFNTTTIDVSSLRPGFYFLALINNNRKYIQKVIIQR